MKAATAKEIRDELKHRSESELLQLCLRLSRFKKENKELLTYLLFEAEDESAYVQSIQDNMDRAFEEINTNSTYYIKKSVRKILRETKKYIRYSSQKETEVELLLHFCYKLKEFRPSIKRNRTLRNIHERQLDLISKKVLGLHEDLRHDYTLELEQLEL